MDDREYLRSLGFTVGERGRFSSEMLEELAKRDKQPTPQEIFNPKTPLREARQLVGYDNEGHKIVFTLCAKCLEHMVWCECARGVHAPRYIHHSQDPLVYVPPIAV